MKEQILSFLSKTVLPFLNKTFVALFAFLAPIGPSLIAVTFLIIADFVFGVMVARKNGIPIQSREMKKTLMKLFIYESMVLVGFLLDKFFIPFDLVVKLTMFGVGIVECKSIMESFQKLTGISLWTMLREKLTAMASAKTKEIVASKSEENTDHQSDSK